MVFIRVIRAHSWQKIGEEPDGAFVFRAKYTIGYNAAMGSLVMPILAVEPFFLIRYTTPV